jgi:hypothetical protein
MSIVPMSCLSSSDLSHLGNNLSLTRKGSSSSSSKRRPRRRRELRAVNRSLAIHGERVQRLYPRLSLAAAFLRRSDPLPAA